MRVSINRGYMGLKWTDSREIGEALYDAYPILIRKRFDSPICISGFAIWRFRRRPAGIQRENPRSDFVSWLDEAE